MKLRIAGIFAFLIIFVVPAYGGMLDDLMDGINKGSIPTLGSEESLNTTIAGLKEALSVGAVNAVGFLSKNDGYFANEAIKILMPEKIQNVADMLKKVGYQQQVDEFILSMNRAAEKAAPQAKTFFLDAIKEMTFDDAKKILNGNETAATEYLKSKTYNKIYDSFKPTVVSSLDQVGGTRAYNEMMKTFTSLPFMSAQSLDLNHYVTTKALDGLFYTVGEEEKKIRTDPTARVTDLLKKVFAKQ